jgi:hypothetical protein
MPISTALFKFPVMPRPTAQTWAHVENLHKWVLDLCAVCGPSDAERNFVKFVDTLNLVTPDDSLPVHERVTELHQYYSREGKACPLPGRNAYTSIILPRSSYLKSIDPDGKMSYDDLMKATKKDIDMFNAMMESPAGFESAYPAVPYDELLRLHESFVLCEPIPKRWGRWGVWKCGCDDCFADGLCGHGMLLSMVFDKTITFPPQYSTRELAKRNSKGKRPTAWCPEQEDDEEDPAARQHWCPVTMASREMPLLPKVNQSLVTLTSNFDSHTCLTEPGCRV